MTGNTTSIILLRYPSASIYTSGNSGVPCCASGVCRLSSSGYSRASPCGRFDREFWCSGAGSFPILFQPRLIENPYSDLIICSCSNYREQMFQGKRATEDSLFHSWLCPFEIKSTGLIALPRRSILVGGTDRTFIFICKVFTNNSACITLRLHARRRAAQRDYRRRSAPRIKATSSCI